MSTAHRDRTNVMYCDMKMKLYSLRSHSKRTSDHIKCNIECNLSDINIDYILFVDGSSREYFFFAAFQGFNIKYLIEE